MADNDAAKVKKPLTKSIVFQEIAAATNLSRAQVGEVFEAMVALIKKELGKKGPGVFTIPGLVKLRTVRKPATKARKGINPFTKEEIMIKAKPATNAVKPLALKALKELVK
jgi:nucleoid DNA-binding protein